MHAGLKSQSRLKHIFLHLPFRQKGVYVERIYFLMEISMSGSKASRTDLDDLFRTLAAIRTLSDPIDLGEQILMPATEISLSFVTGSGCAVGEENDGNEDRRDDWDLKRCVAGGIAAVSPVAVVFISRKCSGRKGIGVLAVSPSGDRIPAAVERLVEMAMSGKTGKG